MAPPTSVLLILSRVGVRKHNPLAHVAVGVPLGRGDSVHPTDLPCDNDPLRHGWHACGKGETTTEFLLRYHCTQEIFFPSQTARTRLVQGNQVLKNMLTNSTE